ncbi:sugar kinase [Silicimonas algicola]|uniref:2-dehydro-3-deoxygluconokinase n=1 Tax=Silicimonas algicola TaxID=1826607 RepID=A0A316GKW5_9RHOB|nr:sugar kinase [Silicimonas algicola]AZQ67023.1 sugar kinase [Silicimonas algicola]PWK55457.1 2-dehydro-3-deoxygluconokinase [Silicimonas algicola]
MTRVLCLGEVMVELSLEAADPTRASVGIAGDTYNTAVYLKRSASELEVAYATRLGRDRFSAMIRERLRDEGISDDFVTESDDRLPGLYAISTDAGGERSFHYWRDRSAYRTYFDAPGPDLEAMATFDVIYHSAISIAVLPNEARGRFLDWLANYRADGGCVIFDSNYRPRLWPDAATARDAIERAWRTCDIGLPSLDDEIALYGDENAQAVIDRLHGWGVAGGALKRGAEGPLSLSGATCPDCPPAPRVVDSTAAGDSFNGGYLGARLTGVSEAEALAAGHALASQVVQHRGAILPRGEDT